MRNKRNYRFTTTRLLVDEWQSLSESDWPLQDISATVRATLSATVTQSLPPHWQGPYDDARARQWIEDRNAEGTTLLAIDTANRAAIGMIILFEENGHLRLGYMLRESAWGVGYASELIAGFVAWCRRHDVLSVTGGVEHTNVASRRVLEKCGFTALAKAQASSEQLFRIETQ